jgi:hypothetical protein
LKNLIVETRVIGSDKTYWLFQYKKVTQKQSLFQRIFGCNGWQIGIPIYSTKSEAKAALKVDMERIKKQNPYVQFVN